MKQTPIYFSQQVEKFHSALNEGKYSSIFILTDENTYSHCLPVFLESFEFNFHYSVIKISAGEENKTLKTAEKIWETVLAENADRKSLFINLGGGMITDLGGFAASTFMRGIDFINIPTSLLGMVDAAIGGKTGVDFNGGKNIIGYFNMPVATFIFPEFLKTLPKREFVAGYAEMLKHGLIYSKEHWEKLTSSEDFPPENLDTLIQESCEIKMAVVKEDSKEQGLRKILNFGHTIGHAVESEYLNSENPFLHGEAIAIGMLIESILSFQNGFLNENQLNEVFSGILKFFDKITIPENKFDDLLRWTKHDKKNQNEKISFSLIDGIGSCKTDVFLEENQILEGIKEYNAKLKEF